MAARHSAATMCMRAVANVNSEIAHAVTGMDAANQAALDARLIALDGTPNKSRLGANAVLSVSMAAAHAAAHAADLPLFRYLADTDVTLIPLPQIQIFGGGAHAGRRVDIQDFMVMCPAAETFRPGAGVDRGGLSGGGKVDGGGRERWPVSRMRAAGGRRSPPTSRRWTRWFARSSARGSGRASRSGIALDIAASEFGRDGRYKLALEDRELDSAGMIAMLSGWISRYPILSIEDPLAEDDAAGFAEFTRLHGKSLQIVGDDFLVSDAARVTRGRRQGRRQYRAAETQSTRHADRDVGRLERGEGSRVRRDRVGPVGRDRGYHDRSPRRRLGGGPTESRQFRAKRADGEVERNAADRGSVGLAGPVRRRRGTGSRS